MMVPLLTKGAGGWGAVINGDKVEKVGGLSLIPMVRRSKKAGGSLDASACNEVRVSRREKTDRGLSNDCLATNEICLSDGQTEEL